MKKTKLDELLKGGAVTEEEYKDLLPTCEDDTGEPDGGEPEPEDPLAGLDEKTRAAVEKMLQSERDRAANRVGNAKKKELEDSKRQYEELKAALEELKKAKLTEDERKELERKEAADKLAAQQKEFAEMKNRYLAAQELKAAGLDIADDIVSLVLGADEDDTKARVKSFADLIDKLVADKVKARFQSGGGEPRKGGSAVDAKGNPWAKGSINYSKQMEILATDPERAKALMAAADAT